MSTRKQTKTNETRKTLRDEFTEFLTSEHVDEVEDITSYHNHVYSYKDLDDAYGVELELQNDSEETRTSITKFMRYKFRANVETDSSLDNTWYPLEIISQPYTKEEWTKNKELVYEFFDLIRDLDLYTDEQTGLHIHISKELFGETDAIRENNANKLILIIENYKREFLKFSRRDGERLGYCDFMSSYCKPYKDLYTIKNKKQYSHYKCINNDGRTYEYRLNLGTTDARTFIASLQLMWNLVEVIKRDDLTSLSFDDIVNLHAEYTELIDYCKALKIKNGTKVIDKTKTMELLQLRENNKVLKENWNYNKYIARVRELITNNMELYDASKQEFKNYNDLNCELGYIFTQTFIKNNNLYLHCRNINDLLSNYRVAYITDLETGTQSEKRIFNKNYKTQYRDAMQKLEELIKSKGGVI